MSERAHVRAIARTELRRRLRAIQEEPAQLIAILIAGLFFVPVAMFGPIGAYMYGSSLAAGTLESPLESGTLVAVYGWVFVAAFGGYRAYATALRPDRLDGYLTTVSHRELLGGLLLAEGVLWGVPIVALGGASSLTFAAGTGSMLAALGFFVAICSTFATALVVGWALALVVMNGGVRSTLLARLRFVALAGVAIAYFSLLMTGNFGALFDPLIRVLEPTPVAWLGDLLVVGASGDASLIRAGGAVLTSAFVLLASPVVLSRLAAWLWYADGRSVEREVAVADVAGARSSRLDRFLPRSVVGVVSTDWKRARREPIALSFAIYPLIVLINPLIRVFETGTIGGSFPLWVLLSGAWITGALFALNVVGNEGAALPATLLSRTPGRALVAGHVVAGVLVCVPVTVVATVGLGIASPHSPAAVVTLAAGALVLSLCAGPIATGIGAMLPRFEAVDVARSTKAIVPSTLAFAVYSVVVVIVSLPAILGHSAIVGHAIASLLGTEQIVVAVGGTALSALVAVPIAGLSARYAIRSVETYHFT
ncbi:hypothetical protein [Natronobacterium texcoconense]|uniref:ABC-2 type transport system permease protein n=1 Tax=Natronobacterium texcoconense TaxID=1095778 RepID=A0A1H1F4I4_NATTX|nr:hypothetical protein [Natronobacterium texcoconense]SDQ95912.1 hypothetical protein SAMN04489842_1820 [Natronobacterium texcoconense]